MVNLLNIFLLFFVFVHFKINIFSFFSAYLSIILFVKFNIHICHFFIFQIQTLNF